MVFPEIRESRGTSQDTPECFHIIKSEGKRNDRILLSTVHLEDVSSGAMATHRYKLTDSMMKVNPVRNSSGPLNPAGIILKSNPAVAAGPEGLWPGGSSVALFLTG